MGRFKYGLALFAAKVSIVALKITKHNGTNFPGVVALKICPEFIKYIKKPDTVIAVTGTNGKTTVSNMLKDMFKELNVRVLNNSSGSNINTGVATCLISGVTLFGKEKYEYGVLEIDERSARLVYPYLKPDYMIVNNLSRDSIMRNGHPEYIGRVLTEYIPAETKLILNADDLLSANIAPRNERVYFGIEKMEGDRTETDDIINDLRICPICSHQLKYEYVRYSSTGKAYCPNCDFSSPEYDMSAFEVNKRNMTMKFGEKKNRDEAITFPIMNEGIFNIYNQIAIITLLKTMGYSFTEICSSMEKTNIVKSRYNYETVGDKKIIKMLAKDRNAYACSRVFEYIKSQPGTKEIILMVNNLDDARTWSENTCWLYDCDFENLKDPSVINIISVGDRGRDYLLRLLMAGINKETCRYVQDALEAPCQLKMPSNDNIYVLYGTDSVALGNKVAAKVKKRAEAKKESM